MLVRLLAFLPVSGLGGAAFGAQVSPVRTGQTAEGQSSGEQSGTWIGPLPMQVGYLLLERSEP